MALSKQFNLVLILSTCTPLILLYILKKKHRINNEKLNSQLSDNYYESIFLGPPNFSCRPHLFSKQECGEYCSYVQVERLASYMNSAKISLNLCMYMLTLKQIMKALLRAQRRGIKIKVITDNITKDTSPAAGIFDILRGKGIPIKTSSKLESMMHHKFCLIDKEEPIRAKMFYGSANLTAQAFCKNFEALILTNNWELIQSLGREFDELWQIFEPC